MSVLQDGSKSSEALGRGAAQHPVCTCDGEHDGLEKC